MMVCMVLILTLQCWHSFSCWVCVSDVREYFTASFLKPINAPTSKALERKTEPENNNKKHV